MKHGVKHDELTDTQAVEIILFHFNRSAKIEGVSEAEINRTSELIKEIRKAKNPAEFISKWQFSEWVRSK